MEKIRLKNGQEFDLVPMGISDNAMSKRKELKLISSLTYAEVETLFLNNDNVSKLDHILESGEVNRSYYDCVSLKSLSKVRDYPVDENTISDIYVAELSTDEITKKIQLTETAQTNLELALCEVYEIILGGM